MKELFLLKLGEIVLKGQNRRVFEDKLKTVTRRRMVKFGEFKVSIVQSTLYVEPLTDDCDLDGAWEACGTIFGVAQMCRCRACEKNLDAMFAAVCDYLGEELSMAKSFKVESKRSDKRFPLNSIQISQEIGGRLAEEFPNVLVAVSYTHLDVYKRQIYGGSNSTFVEYDDIPKNLINACIAIEDKRFEKHQGVDWVTTMRACFKMFLGKKMCIRDSIRRERIP